MPANKHDVFARLTDDIIAILEAGDLPPWCATWQQHQNLISRNAYRGINQVALDARAQRQGYTSPYWLTFNQCRELGGHVRKGEQSAIVVKWLWFAEKDQETGETKEHGRKWSRQKYFCVFNLEQCAGIETPLPEAQAIQPIAYCEAIVDTMPNRPPIEHKGTRAFYAPLSDAVTVPARPTFESSEAYYATLFHELGHSTGHAKRLGRKEVMDINFFGSHDYSQEELCAESCAAFLCGVTGIETRRTLENAKAYIKDWLAALKDDRTCLVSGIQNGQKAADYILGVQLEYED